METSSEYFEIFQAEARRWIDYFSLNDWEVDFIHEDKEGEAGQAYCITSSKQKVACLVLAKTWDPRWMNEREVCKSAFHEVIELLLAEVEWIAEKRNFEQDDMTRAKHGVIQRLTNTVWQDTWNNEQQLEEE